MASAKKKTPRTRSAVRGKKGGAARGKSVGGRRARGPRAQVASGSPTVLVVNMIPSSLSHEENQDSEPTLSVNPTNPLHIAASAFTPDPAEGALAPIYLSTDGGNTWTLNSIVPSVAGQSMTADITVSFGTGDRLYAGIIRLPIVNDTPRLNILKTDNFQNATAMTVLVDRTGSGVDQPYVQAISVNSGGATQERIYVGDNDFSPPSPGKTATIDQSPNGPASTPAFSPVRIETRTTAGQDGPPVRPCPHADGTVYAVFHSWRSFDGKTGNGTADIVVVRDDQGGAGATPFTALKDSEDGLAGVRVAEEVQFNFNGHLGLQRTGGDVAIAVDPRNSSTLYVAYNGDDGSGYQLHLVRSTNRGLAWSPDLQKIPNALNAALAVNDQGTVALLYQQLSGSGAAQRWLTTCIYSSDGAHWNTVTLASTPATNPPRQFEPYLGDYEHLLSVGKDFYGIFAASNIPDMGNFPQGVSYQRNADFTSKTLKDVDNTTPVHPSIDPFFFKMTM